jgi:hypothetical protein
MMTVVEEMDPGHPQSWQAAAKIAVCSIFSSVDKLLEHFAEYEESGKSRLVSSAAGAENDDFLNSVLEGLSLLDTQFEGMLNNSKWFDSDPMYWAEEWKVLGTLAAAAGIKNGNLNDISPAVGHPEIRDFQSASAGVFESWMLREDITSTIIRKQTDYGHHNIARFGRHGILVRCHDKIARLKNLHLARNGKAANESLSDTYVDIIGYSAIGMMWERDWFLLELE